MCFNRRRRSACNFVFACPTSCCPGGFGGQSFGNLFGANPCCGINGLGAAYGGLNTAYSGGTFGMFGQGYVPQSYPLPTASPGFQSLSSGASSYFPNPSYGNLNQTNQYQNTSAPLIQAPQTTQNSLYIPAPSVNQNLCDFNAVHNSSDNLAYQYGDVSQQQQFTNSSNYPNYNYNTNGYDYNQTTGLNSYQQPAMKEPTFPSYNNQQSNVYTNCLPNNYATPIASSYYPATNYLNKNSVRISNSSSRSLITKLDTNRFNLSPSPSTFNCYNYNYVAPSGMNNFAAPSAPYLTAPYTAYPPLNRSNGNSLSRRIRVNIRICRRN